MLMKFNFALHMLFYVLVNVAEFMVISYSPNNILLENENDLVDIYRSPCKTGEKETMDVEESADNCPGCKKNEVFSESELKQLRYEFIKSEILKTLNLDAVPVPSDDDTKLSSFSLRSLIESLPETSAMKTEAQLENDEDSGEENIVIFPRDIDNACESHREEPCKKFMFKFPENFDTSSLRKVELWFHKAAYMETKNLSAVILGLQEVNLLCQNTTHDDHVDDTNWTKFSLELSHPFTIIDNSLIGIKTEVYGADVSDTGEEKPFAIVHIKKQQLSSSRSRRSSDCLPDSSNCCRQTFYLSFADIGWDHWIIYPHGYNANFCKGQCLRDVNSPMYFHGSIMHKFARNNRTAAENIGLTTCCAPSKLSPLSMIYKDHNGTIHHKSFENMIVESCGCA